jgi:CheY-like chemotaxis protein
MPRKILIVSPNATQLVRVKEVLEKELLNISIAIDLSTNDAEAREKICGGNHDLVVTSLDIPKDSKTLTQEGLRRGLALAKWLENEKENIRTILLAIPADAELNKMVNQLDNCELVNEELGWEDLFIKRVKQALEGGKETEEKRLDVDIIVNIDANILEARFTGVNFACEIPYLTQGIEGGQLLTLVAESEALETDSTVEWQARLQHIGEGLMKHIFQRDMKFYSAFIEMRTIAGGLPNTRIRFIVEEKVHPLALEAIYGQHGQLEEDYWMLHAPIYRTVGKYGGWKYPLFHDRETRKGPLNILIIESPVEGEVEIKEKKTGSIVTRLKLERLENVRAECGFLKNYPYSPEYPGGVRIGKIEVIPKPEDHRPVIDQVRETLEHANRVWHIVHYAGHSYFDPSTNEGYVFFPGGKDETGRPTIKEVDLELLSVWLRMAEARLVFLSSCHSSEKGFVFALARKQIPATVGFRWDIEDHMAAEYTRVFYRELFGGEARSLEDAFLKARQNIYGEHREDLIWATPVLVVQLYSEQA